MSTPTPTVDYDIIDATREDDIDNIISHVREHQDARDGGDASRLR